MKIFAMSDIHGCLDAFLDALSLVDLEDKNNKLVLCGDYIHGGFDSYAVVEKIIELKKKYKSKVVVLMGNREYWEQGTSDYYHIEKFPPDKGTFCINIVAGHVSTASPYLANNSKFRGIYYDGCSHYYIDGDALKNGVVPVLMYDTDTKKFYEVTELENKELKQTNKNEKYKIVDDV